ncbi:hypothetical protein [Algirhabdus cladophorae]|uniref:hypothetical protein n=1 Tax=Algirhabdus cladophorae TaxID=3377108 RepID=UPI003B849A9E
MIYSLSSFQFDPETGPKRRIMVGKDSQPKGFENRYDFNTLFYDVVYVPSRSSVVLHCPKLLNFKSILRGATLTGDGKKLGRPRIRLLRRCDEVWIKVAGPISRLQIEGSEISVGLSVNSNLPDFADRRVMVTRSKDNPLDWIEAWVRFHIKHQGVDAILFIDNGSTAYTPEALHKCLSNIDGLESIGVVPAPFRYGGSNTGKLKHLTKFFQSSFLNLVKDRFLAQAAGVLWHDVDELIVSQSGTVFDEAAASKLGYITIPGFWRYAGAVEGRIPNHADHIYRKDPEATCKEKYCLIPNRWAARGTWDVHGIRRYMFNGLVKSSNSRFLHCANLSNSWKRDRSIKSVAAMQIDPATQALFAK